MNHKPDLHTTPTLKQTLKITPSLRQALHILSASYSDLNQLIDSAILDNPVLEKEEWNSEQLAAHAFDELPESMYQPTLTEALQTQIDFLSLSDTDEQIAQAIINNLDEAGYFTLTPKALRHQFDLKKKPSSIRIKKVLRQIQQLEPAGIAATHWAECLRLQIERLTSRSGLYEKRCLS